MLYYLFELGAEILLELKARKYSMTAKKTYNEFYTYGLNKWDFFK